MPNEELFPDGGQEMTKVYVYSDGGCSPNPGRGGFGVVQRYFGANGELHEREFKQGYFCSTNNRMELMGAITALENLDCPCDVELRTDSEYVVKGFTEGRVAYWSSHNWKTKKKTKAANRDLWERLVAAKNRHYNVEFIWVKGHEDDEFNERCDAMCEEARKQPDDEMLVDEGYLEG